MPPDPMRSIREVRIEDSRSGPSAERIPRRIGGTEEPSGDGGAMVLGVGGRRGRGCFLFKSFPREPQTHRFTFTRFDSSIQSIRRATGPLITRTATQELDQA